jgi:hypothetical protein
MLGRYKGVVHFLSGVHHFTIENSEILGAFLGLTIHMPADGGWNVIKNNTITGQRKSDAWFWEYIGKKREVISIDSSEHNRIVNNHFLDMPYGGIYLYRNCGERGDIRHRIPQYNQIINNVFDYSKGNQRVPTVFVGSRDGKTIAKAHFVNGICHLVGKECGGVKKYCHEDHGINGERFTGNDVRQPWDTETVRNSSESNSDWAQHNVIADNQMIQYILPSALPFIGIRQSSKSKKLDNYIFSNESVYNRSVAQALDIQRSRLAGCAVLAGITHGMNSPDYLNEVKNGNIPYLRHNWTVKYFWDIGQNIELTCGTPLICKNNILTVNENAFCDPPIIRDYGAEAQPCNAEHNVCAEGSNAGDEHQLDCPGGNLLGIQAACNLEFGRATDAQRSTVLLNRVEVVRASDDKGDGRCIADGTRIKDGQHMIQPWLFHRYESVGTPNVIRYACKEHDSNGGDCHINVRHYCQPLGPIE